MTKQSKVEYNINGEYFSTSTTIAGVRCQQPGPPLILKRKRPGHFLDARKREWPGRYLNPREDDDAGRHGRLPTLLRLKD